MEDWMAQLQQAGPEAAWDLFLDRYRRLIFAAIRHYAQDYDDVMDVFARVCEALREDDLARLRCYAEQPVHTARFSTWLVTVVRHLTIDWFRHRDGRRRLSALEERRAVALYVMDGRPAAEAARLLGLPNPKAVYSRVYRALSTLRRSLEQTGIHSGDL